MDFLTNPFIVILMWLYQLFGQSLVLAIVVFTILSRLVTYPLTAAQLKSSRKMQELSPRLAELKEKYGKDREKMAQAQMELYREAGVNPLGGCLPLLIQFPVLIGLYGAIYAGLAQTPLQFVDLTHRLLIPGLSDMLPLKSTFLWMQLGQPDTTMILPILTVVTTWLQMKLTTPAPTGDSKDPSAAMSRNMTTIMPLMIGLFSLSFASGLSIYWVVSNVVGIVQYAMMGKVDWGAVFGRPKAAPAPAAVAVESPRERTGSSSSASRKRELAAGSSSSTVSRSSSASNRAAERKRSPDAPVSTARPYTPRKPKTTKGS